MYSPYNRVVINLAALRHNYAVIRAALRHGSTRIIAIVKADAYGHGMIEVARALEGEAGLWGYGVSELWEADALRAAGLSAPILLISGLMLDHERRAAVKKGYIIGVTSVEEAISLSNIGATLGKKVGCHIKLDTGMTRFGIPPRDALNEIVKKISWLKGITLHGLYSHLACADEPENPQNLKQLQTFHSFLKEAKASGWEPGCVHILNSAGAFYFPHAQFSAIRSGIALYGAIHGPKGEDASESFGLKPVMSFYSRVHSLKNVPRGARVGYGASCALKRNTRIAVVPVGYHDGYLRALSNRGYVLIRGNIANILGRVSMRSIVVDVTDCPDVQPGDRVVLLGRDGHHFISAVELARLGSTISYELLCLIGTRNKREFLHPVKEA